VSVVRVLNELERIGDHVVQICDEASRENLADDETRLYDLILTMADEVIERFHTARRAWGSLDLDLAEDLAEGSTLVDALHARLVSELLDLDGNQAVPLALHAAAVGRSLERITDHTSVIGSRLRYLITGDPQHLAAEIR
jgi:phosphate transport system protein